MTPDAVQALLDGTAFVDLSSWRKVSVSGGESVGWLNDLVSADVSGLAPTAARSALLLSPTGRIRAHVTAIAWDGVVLLVQDPRQPNAIDVLLEPYVLSSDVEVEDVSERLALIAFPGRSAPPEADGAATSAPSCTGRGVDLIAAVDGQETLLQTLSRHLAPAQASDLDRWRAVTGIPRLGADATEDDLPEEGGFGASVSYGKGCYLGQEAVAKVRNLGHPRRTLLHVTADGPIAAGDPVTTDGHEVGTVTTAAEHDGRWWALAKVRWEARDEQLVTATGARLSSAARD